jgi:hypothetical protein
MAHEYFSDRELGERPRSRDNIPPNVWGGIVATITSRVENGSFGYRYPLGCPDGKGTAGCDETSFSLALAAEIPDIAWPLRASVIPPQLAILDLLEFCYRAVAKAEEYDFHSFFGHSHLSFNPEEGRTAFRDDVNRILSRNGLAYELNTEGIIVRLAPEMIRAPLVTSVFNTGDPELNSLLSAARVKYLDPDPNVRRESLEKLWDAWERLKTIEPGRDKAASTAALLNRASSEPTFRATLENEARELTSIGNKFRIRHGETTQVPLELNEHVDYLFHRLFSLIRLLLKTTGRSA